MANFNPDDSDPSTSDIEASHGLPSTRRLWAPWRMQYVGGDAKPPDCVFCSYLSETRDEESLILLRGHHAFVIMNLFPYNTGHVMVIPNDHVASPEALPDAALLEMATMRNKLLQAIRFALAPAGFNIGINLGEAAGAGLAMHLHEHIVPRWTGDANFMPIIGGTKVLPELLPATYAKLRAELERTAATVEAPGIFLSSDLRDIYLTSERSSPRVSLSDNTPIWRAIANAAMAKGLSDVQILGWGGTMESLNGAPIILHRVVANPVDHLQPDGTWISLPEAASGPDGPLLEQVRQQIDLFDTHRARSNSID